MNEKLQVKKQKAFVSCYTNQEFEGGGYTSGAKSFGKNRPIGGTYKFK